MSWMHPYLNVNTGDFNCLTVAGEASESLLRDNFLNVIPDMETT